MRTAERVSPRRAALDVEVETLGWEGEPKRTKRQIEARTPTLIERANMATPDEGMRSQRKPLQGKQAIVTSAGEERGDEEKEKMGQWEVNYLAPRGGEGGEQREGMRPLFRRSVRPENADDDPTLRMCQDGADVEVGVLAGTTHLMQKLLLNPLGCFIG